MTGRTTRERATQHQEASDAHTARFMGGLLAPHRLDTPANRETVLNEISASLADPFVKAAIRAGQPVAFVFPLGTSGETVTFTWAEISRALANAGEWGA
jgi:dihydrodipicolinate synthase/N-acetylneuraminate lyase